MNMKLCAGLTVLATMTAGLAMSATPPAPSTPPATAPPPVAPTPTSTTMTYCYSTGSALASCALSWEHMVESGNKIDNAKAAWEASGFINYVSATGFITQDSSWCDPSGTVDNQTMLAAVAKYMRENPDKAASNQAAALTNLALKTAFPCVKKAAH